MYDVVTEHYELEQKQTNKKRKHKNKTNQNKNIIINQSTKYNIKVLIW